MLMNLDNILDAIEVAIFPLEGVHMFVPVDLCPILDTQLLHRQARRLELSRAISESATQLDQITRLLSRISSAFLHVSRDIARFHNSAKTALAPVSILPPEVLQIIFLSGRDQALDEAVYLRCISQVSSRWRETALICPPLWNRACPSYSTPMKITEAYMCRSGSGPLQLVMEEYYTSERLTKMIRLRSSRWSRIRITNRHVATYFLGLVSPQFSALQSLLLRCEIAHPGLEHQLSELPALKALELSKFTLSAESPLPVNLKSLTLILCTTTSSWWRSISQRCTSLETLRVSNVSQTDEFESVIEMSIPTLINLTLRLGISRNPSASMWVAFFANKIHTPSLRSLDAMITNSMGSWFELTKFIQDRPNITHLTIGGDAKPMRRLMNNIVRSNRHFSIVPRLDELVMAFGGDPGPRRKRRDMNGFHRLLVRLLTMRAGSLSRLGVTATWIKDEECIASLVHRLDLIKCTDAGAFDLSS